MSLTLAPREAPLPSAYVIVARTQVCDCCLARHTWSETYSLSQSRSRLGLGSIEQLHAITTPKYRVPIHKRYTLKPERVPFCHSCNEPSLANTSGLLDPLPSSDHLAIVNTAFVAPPLAKPEAPAPRTRTPVTAADIDALIS
jgi:hypothetical protein